MKRRDLFRFSMATAVGAAALGSTEAGRAHGPAPRLIDPNQDASADLARSDWKPEFLGTHQAATLELLGDLIIPAAKSPGAKEALAHRFIDHLLAASPPEIQRDFLASLAFLDGESRSRYGDAFIHLSPESRIELLTFLAYPHRLVTWGSNLSEYAGHVHFGRLKDWISRAYYSSETGMEELGWDQSAMHGPFEGCAQESSKGQEE